MRNSMSKVLPIVLAGVVAGGVEGDATPPLLPLLAGREAIGGKPTAYVCRNYACDLPVTDRAALRRQLESL